MYEKYASGEITQDEYRRAADETEDKKSALSEQIRACQEKLGHLKEDQERLGEDMRQIIRCSHMETLTQELADIFIKKIYVYKDMDRSESKKDIEEIIQSFKKQCGYIAISSYTGTDLFVIKSV